VLEPVRRLTARLIRSPARSGEMETAPTIDAAVSGAGAARELPSIALGLSRYRHSAIAVLAAAIVLLGSVASGWVESADLALVGMGFDPDRAQLLVSLVVAGAAAATAFLFGGSRAAAVPLGLAAACLVFGQTFATETQAALAATGAFGAFDPVGWTVTGASFLTIATLTAWATATLAMPVRRELLLAAGDLARAARRPAVRRHALGRPAAVGLGLILIAGTLPVAVDLFNYGADSHLVTGGPPRQGLVPDGGAAPSYTLASESASATPTSSATAASSPAGSPSQPPTAPPTPTALPWKASPPTGQSRMVYLAFAAPWKNAGTQTLEVAVYLPPGYDRSGSKRYPTYYEAPFAFWLWNSGIHIEAMLDSLIDDGTIPPSLFVFVNAGGYGPYPDSECADSFDGVETMDRFLGVTVPTYVDKHYRTIAKAAARTTFGMSEGGYCAAILALHHPDVFGGAIPISGYFTAGAASAAGKLPFGNNPSVVARDSPGAVAPGLPGIVRVSLYFVLIVQPSQIFYGSQAASFAQVLAEAGYPHDVIESSQPHGWPQVRDDFGRALALIAVRQAENGVFD
jgi:enterochelin esterase-like enzyme